MGLSVNTEIILKEKRKSYLYLLITTKIFTQIKTKFIIFKIYGN